MLREKYINIILWNILFLFCCFFFTIAANAETAGNLSDAQTTDTGSLIWENLDTGYRTVIEDDAGLLSDNELSLLSLDMQDTTAYGNAAFKSVSYNYSSASSFARDYYHELFGQTSGTLFLIDMDNREIYIFSDGAVYRTITNSYANTITDNVYRYASEQNYYLCASKAFEQINKLLAGRKISQPMKYISNALLALILAVLINYFIIRVSSQGKKAAASEILKASSVKFAFHNPKKQLTGQSKVYCPSSSGSGGGSHGGGHSGGGHSGGGGGHRF